MPVQRPRLGRSLAPTVPLERRHFLTRIGTAIAGIAVMGSPRRAEAGTTGIEPFIGELMIFAGNFAPRGWAFCNGQLLPIAQNTALFSLLGTMYGGNGQTTFALPDLRGRAPIHAGQGPGLSDFTQGEFGGEENHTLTVAEMPAHTHTAFADATNGTVDLPVNALPARNPASIPAYGAGTSATLAANHVGAAGGSQPHNNMPPYLVLNYCIALEGVFPSRS